MCPEVLFIFGDKKNINGNSISTAATSTSSDDNQRN